MEKIKGRKQRMHLWHLRVKFLSTHTAPTDIRKSGWGLFYHCEVLNSACNLKEINRHHVLLLTILFEGPDVGWMEISLPRGESTLSLVHVIFPWSGQEAWQRSGRCCLNWKWQYEWDECKRDVTHRQTRSSRGPGRSLLFLLFFPRGKKVELAFLYFDYVKKNFQIILLDRM